MFEIEDEIEAQGEAFRKLIIEGAQAKGLTPHKIGQILAELTQDDDSSIRLGATKELVDLMAARPSRVQKRKELGEQRMLQVKFEGHQMLGFDPNVLKRLPPEQRMLVLEAQKAIEAVTTETSNGS